MSALEAAMLEGGEVGVRKSPRTPEQLDADPLQEGSVKDAGNGGDPNADVDADDAESSPPPDASSAKHRADTKTSPERGGSLLPAARAASRSPAATRSPSRTPHSRTPRPSQRPIHLPVKTAMPFERKLSSNPVYGAYAAMLEALLLAPPSERQYVSVVPLSGWGNKIRVVATGLQLALAMERILVLDGPTMQPFYGSLFSSPFDPWLTTKVDGLPRWNVQQIVLKAPHKRNKAMKCWAATRELSRCINFESRGVSFEGYFNGDSYVRADAELREGLNERLMPFFPDAEARGLPERSVVDHFASRALLPELKPGLRGTLDGAKADMQWQQYKLRVGVHMRVFVDYWRRRVSVTRINPRYWKCITQHVASLQAARNATPSETLIFVASDLPAARPKAREALSSVAAVKWASSKRGFQHSETKRDASALGAVMTDWWLLSETDMVVGTDLSTFGPTAAVHGGVPLLIASMKPGGRSKCEHVRAPNYGTVN